MTQPVLEIAAIKVREDKVAAFLDGVRASVPLFQAAKGFRSLALRRSVEEPLLFRLMIEWATLEDHTEAFRNSDAFQQWRSNVGHCFAEPPSVDHSIVEVAG
jgi:quinol monooxygenase YgiN